MKIKSYWAGSACLLAGFLSLTLVTLSGCSEENPPRSLQFLQTQVETVELKVAYSQGEGLPEYEAVKAFGERLREVTGGHYALELVSNEVLGGELTSLELVQAGKLDFAIVSSPLMENWNRDFRAINLPYMYRDVGHLKRIVSSPLITKQLFHSVEDQGLTVLCAFYAGQRGIYTREKKIRVPIDLKDQKIRVQQSESLMAMIRAMGGRSVPMPLSEVRTALGSGVIDGADNGIVPYYVLGHYQQAPIFNESGHLMGIDLLVINTKRLRELPPEVRKFIEEQIKAGADNEFALFQTAEIQVREAAREAGVQFVRSYKRGFREMVRPLLARSIESPLEEQIFNLIDSSYDDPVMERADLE